MLIINDIVSCTLCILLLLKSILPTIYPWIVVREIQLEDQKIVQNTVNCLYNFNYLFLLFPENRHWAILMYQTIIVEIYD